MARNGRKKIGRRFFATNLTEKRADDHLQKPEKREETRGE